VQFGHELKPVHLGHHQVQQDQIGSILRHPPQANLPVCRIDDAPTVPLQDAPQQLARGVVILDDQNPAGRPIISLHHMEQSLPVNRFGEVISGPQGKALVLVLLDRGHDDRDIDQTGIGLEFGQHVPSVHYRHTDVEDDDVGTLFPGQA